jgi:GDP/UDP-N,N'-diacetylbacillosamine 2-epimerase (hydrolysing)
MSNYFKKINPDAVILHGDRYEILASAISCFFLSIPIIHLSGGEVTYGSKDDTIRHVLTKLSSLHFVSTKMHRKRVIQLGEHPSTVFNVGDFGVERLNFLRKKKKIIENKKKLEKILKFKFNKKNILITFHPDTYKTRNKILKDIKIVFRVIDKLKETNFIFTSPNSDQNNDLIESEIKKFLKKNKDRSLYVASLGDINYYSVLNFVDCVLGNSSSGITEVPEFKIPTINVGNRQLGRLSSKSVINCNYNEKSIKTSLKKIYDINFKKIIKKAKNPYLSKNGSVSIVKVILKKNLNNLLPKKFYDLKKI